MNPEASGLLGIDPSEYVPRVDPDEAKATSAAFFDALHENRNGDVIIASGFLIGPKLYGVTERRFAWPTERDEMTGWISHEAVLGRDVFHLGSLVNEKGLRRDGNAWEVFAELHAREVEDLPQPTIVVWSAPDLVQCYWKSTEQMPIPAAERIITRLGWSHARLLRVPGTLNHRYHGAPKVQLLLSGGPTYELSELTFMPAVVPCVERAPDPVPSLRPEVIANAVQVAGGVASSTGVRTSIGVAAALLALVGGIAVPGNFGQDRRDIGTASASLGFQEDKPFIVRGLSDNTFGVADPPAKTVTKAAGAPTVSTGKPPASPQGQARRVLREVRDGDVGSTTGDGLPAPVVEAADTVRNSWQRATSPVMGQE